MFTDERAIGILQRLLEKTRAGQVQWNSGTPDEPATEFEEINAYYLQLPSSRLMVSFVSPELVEDRVVVEFDNNESVTVKRLEIGEGDPDWPLAIALYEEAGRVTVGWDKVLHDLEDAASSQGTIGLPVN